MRAYPLLLPLLIIAGCASCEADPQPEAAPEFDIQGDDFSLPAIEVLPETGQPVSCVIFFAGSGPTDRNWNSDAIPMGGRNGSAQQLAAALADEDIGSLRFDKVGSGTNRTPISVLSMDHYVDETMTAYRYLSRRSPCNQIFLLGHSEGALHVLRSAVELQNEPDFGGVVTMSGPGRILLDVLIDQLTQQSDAAGYSHSQVAQAMRTLRQAVYDLPQSATNPPAFSSMPDLATFWQITMASGDPALIRELLLFDPLDTVRQYHGPILVMSAGNDVQIPDSDSVAIYGAVPNSGQLAGRVTIPDANHVYKVEERSLIDADQITLVMAYFEQGRPLADGTVDSIVEFIEAVEGL